MPSRRHRSSLPLGGAVIPIFLAAAVLLGGASAAGFAANLLLQLAALLLIVAALLLRPAAPLPRSGRQLLALAGLLLGLFAVQLIPLPPAIWAALPGRAAIARGFGLLGAPVPWEPLSLAPLRTWASLFWLLPAFAALIATVRLGAFRARWTAWTLVTVALLSVALGAVQLAGGMESRGYIYRVTNYGVAVGFFANANHLGTLMLVTIPFLAALLGDALGRQRDRQRSSALILGMAGALLVILIGLAITGSLAAIGLAAPTAAASFFIARARDRAIPRWALPVIVVLGLAAVAIVMSQPFNNNLTGKEAASPYSRRTAYSVTLAATATYLPVGSGIGSFLDIYRQRENPAAVTTTYMNHAHSDLLEVALETGIPGLALLALLLWWWVSRTVALWREDEASRWARAATVASGAIMAHSLVDYPLRTAAISTLFAFCLALMAGARERMAGSSKEPIRRAKHLTA